MKWLLTLLTLAVLTALLVMPRAPEVREARLDAQGREALLSLQVRRSEPAIPLASRSPSSSAKNLHKPLEGMRICIDPGHGGQVRWDKIYYTGGTYGIVTGQCESDVNLRVSLCLRAYLEAAGAEVIMTRISDDRVTKGGTRDEELDFRPNLAKRRKADLFISVHHNEAARREANYTVVFYPTGTEHSITLADNISSAVSRYLGTQNIGARPGSYRVLQGCSMPGVIVEASFMSNADEDRRLASLAYNKMEARAIATGILNYVRLTKGTEVDFNALFEPIDENSGSAQYYADASFVRRELIETKSLFGKRIEEVTYDATGAVVARRDVTNARTNTRGSADASAAEPESGSRAGVINVSNNAKSVGRSLLGKKPASSSSRR